MLWICLDNYTINYDTTILLTLADVRCTVASTRKKMVNWMMCCMVSERTLEPLQ